MEPARMERPSLIQPVQFLLAPLPPPPPPANLLLEQTGALGSRTRAKLGPLSVKGPLSLASIRSSGQKLAKCRPS